MITNGYTNVFARFSGKIHCCNVCKSCLVQQTTLFLRWTRGTCVPKIVTDLPWVNFRNSIFHVVASRSYAYLFLRHYALLTVCIMMVSKQSCVCMGFYKYIIIINLFLLYNRIVTLLWILLKSMVRREHIKFFRIFHQRNR